MKDYSLSLGEFPWEYVESIVFEGNKICVNFKSGSSMEAEGDSETIEEFRAECGKNLAENQVRGIL